MYEPEVVGIDSVLGDDLGMHLHPLVPRPAIGTKRVEPLRSDVVAEHRERVGRLPQRVPAFAVMPDQDRVVELCDRVRTYSPALVGPILIGNTHVASSTVPHPAVKRTLDAFLDYAATMGQARAKMLAVRVQHLRHAVELPECDQIPAEVVHRDHVGDGEVGTPGDLEPSGGQHARQGLHDRNVPSTYDTWQRQYLEATHF